MPVSIESTKTGRTFADMSETEVRDLLERLKNEIEDAELDAETRKLMMDLNAEIQGLIDSDADVEAFASVADRAREIEADFESDHPLAIRVLREIMHALARMGI